MGVRAHLDSENRSCKEGKDNNQVSARHQYLECVDVEQLTHNSVQFVPSKLRIGLYFPSAYSNDRVESDRLRKREQQHDGLVAC